MTPPQHGNIAIPGLIYQRLQSEFPKRRPVREVQVFLRPEKDKITQDFQLAERIHLLRTDETALVQLGPHFLAVHHFRPYPTWHVFLPLIKKCLASYIKAAQPGSILRIGLRYINKIEIPAAESQLEKWLRFYPYLAPPLPRDIASFMAGVDILYEAGRDNLRLQTTSAVPERPDIAPVLLDIYYTPQRPGSISLEDVECWLELAHTRIEEAFEHSISDSLRTLFQGDEK